jgi:NADH dehydrogenase
MNTPATSPARRIVIVGGGAGGLELAAKLGRLHGPEAVLLVDAHPFHIWKPTLHEAAAGTMDIQQEGLSYLLVAHLSRFTFALGTLLEVNRDDRSIRVGAVSDAQGESVLPERVIGYDTLVLSIGSMSNFFSTRGAEQYAVTLDTTNAAEQFRLTMLRAMVQVDQAKLQDPTARLNVVIVGGGATGVELAAELREAGTIVGSYGLRNFNPQEDLVLTVIEGAPRILAALPERISKAALRKLTELHIRVETGAKVQEVTANSVKCADGREFPARLCLWAAGIQGPTVLHSLGLPMNRVGQLVVNDRLQTEDPDIIAFGDCAAAPWTDGKTVPARAQAAHQQADYLVHVLTARLRNLPPPDKPYVYQDHGSLVSLGSNASVGSLMGKLSGRGLFISGTFARLMYISLHLMHHYAVLGASRTFSMALARLLMRRSRPRVKLH